MKTINTHDASNRTIEVSSDGRTVWVNDWNGYCIGRFSAMGIDVHAAPDDTDTGHCLDCRQGSDPFGKPCRKEYARFVESMIEYHQVDLTIWALITDWREEANPKHYYVKGILALRGKELEKLTKKYISRMMGAHTDKGAALYEALLNEIYDLRSQRDEVLKLLTEQGVPKPCSYRKECGLGRKATDIEETA